MGGHMQTPEKWGGMLLVTMGLAACGTPAPSTAEPPVNVPSNASPTPALIIPLQPSPTTVPAACLASNLSEEVMIYIGPSQQYDMSIMMGLPDAVVTGQTEDGTWLQINLSGALFWVRPGDIDLNGDCSAVPVIDVETDVSIPPLPTPTPQETETPSVLPTPTPRA